MKFSWKKGVAVVSALSMTGGGIALAQIMPPPPALPAPAPVLPPPPPLNDYKTPIESRDRLGKINDLLAYAPTIERDFKGLKKILQLPNGVLFIDADLDTDADGSPRALEIDPQYGQLETSLSFANEEGQRQYVDAEKVPYIVLPLEFYKEMGIKKGDVAAVIWKGRVIYALFADTGPKDLIGEGSVALSEALGFDPWEEKDGQMQIVSGIESDVLMFVFPNSADDDITPENVNLKTIERAKALFQELGGKVD